MRLRAPLPPLRRAFRLRRGFGVGRCVALRAAALKDGDGARSAFAFAERGFFPSPGDARASGGLFPRSLASFPVTLDVGFLLLPVRHFA